MTSPRRVLALALATPLFFSPAVLLAQDADAELFGPGVLVEEFEVVDLGVSTSPNQFIGGSHTQWYLQAYPEGEFEIEIEETEDGELSIWLDGEEVPSRWIRREPGKVELTDDAGRVIACFKSLDTGPFEIPVTGLWRSVPLPEIDAEDISPAPEPRALIGIYAVPITDATAYQLDIQDEAVVVKDVLAGYPAERAGLEQYDIITHLDGEAGVTFEDLRGWVTESNDGDAIQLGILRRGRPLDIRVTIEVAQPPEWQHFPSGLPEAFEGIIDVEEEYLRRLGEDMNSEDMRWGNPPPRPVDPATEGEDLRELENEIRELEAQIRELHEELRKEKEARDEQ